MHLERLLRQQPLHDPQPFLREREVVRAGRDVLTQEILLSELVVAERIRDRDIVAWEILHLKQASVTGARAGSERFGTDLRGWAQGDGVPCILEAVAGVLADLLCAVGVMVVEGRFRAEFLDQVEVAR